jgi:DNA-binding NarL/FixJ family response regulator
VTLRVLLADDQALVRSAFAMLISAAPGMTVVGEAEDGVQAVELAARTRPDVVLMDIRMPGTDGIEATRQIAADLATTRVIVLTTYDTDENVAAALRAGAAGFLVKDIRPVQLLEAITTVAAGDSLLSPGPTASLIRTFLQHPDTPPPTGPNPAIAALSARERQVLIHVARGLSNAEIGTLLQLSPLTVKTHVSRIMTKLAARDRVHLVITAYQSGLITTS